MNDFIKKHGKLSIVLGSQWGDEGKGKLIDILSEKYDVIARATGGANAGHTVIVGSQKFVFHLVPSGILRDDKICIIGNGCVLHLPTIIEELTVLEKAGISYEGRLFISERAHLTFDYHKEIDGLQESRKGDKKVGTTKRGIGPSYSDKINRIGIRIGELKDFGKFEEHFKECAEAIFEQYGVKIDVKAEIELYKKMAEKFVPMIIDTSLYLNNALSSGKSVLVEGANGAMLDIDHGTYPYVTSSNATIGGVIAGIGVSPFKVNSCIGIVKAYTTRVGAGPFPTEDLGEIGEKLRDAGGEFGATTGRPRRCGWFDTVVVNYTKLLNGYTSVNLTKLDVLNDFEKIKIGVEYRLNGKKIDSFPSSLAELEKVEVVYEELPGWMTDISNVKNFKDLPLNAQKYVKRIEELISVPIDFIGVGAGREQMIVNS